MEKKNNNNGLSGLINLGNTCYMNAIIQCLSHTKILTDELLGNDLYLKIIQENIQNDDFKLLQKKDKCLFINYYIIIKLLWNNCSVINPQNFYTLVLKISSFFNRFEQHDSSEFLYFLLDRLDEELSYTISIDKNIKKNKNLDDKLKERIIKSLDYYINFLTNKNVTKFSIIKQQLYGLKNTKVICNECKNLSESFEMFSSLQLNIPSEIDNLTLTDCLDLYVKKEILKGENSFFCNKCNKLVNKGYQWIKLWNTPNIMIIQVVRFVNNNNSSKKVTKLIDIPKNINLKKYTDTNYGKYLELENTCFDYTLYASCCHLGSLNGGHYFSIVQKDSNWYRVDDDDVFLISNETNLNELLKRFSYILFYKKNPS